MYYFSDREKRKLSRITQGDGFQIVTRYESDVCSYMIIIQHFAQFCIAANSSIESNV